MSQIPYKKNNFTRFRLSVIGVSLDSPPGCFVMNILWYGFICKPTYERILDRALIFVHLLSQAIWIFEF